MSPNRKTFIASSSSSPRDEGRGKGPLADLITPSDEYQHFGNISSDESSNINNKRRKLEIGGGSRNTATKENASVCIECDKKFPTRRDLYWHMRSHLEVNSRGQQPQFDAEEIGVATTLMILAAEGRKDYGKKMNATGGMGVGEADGFLFSCSRCMKTFKSRLALRKHQGSHKNIPRDEGCSANKERGKGKRGDEVPFILLRYKCDICGRHFSNPQGLGSHRRTHVPREEKKKALMIDLNFPPESEEKDEE